MSIVTVLICMSTMSHSFSLGIVQNNAPNANVSLLQYVSLCYGVFALSLFVPLSPIVCK